ncbi:hypothetical protein D3C72_2290050 [compost metagenome]
MGVDPHQALADARDRYRDPPVILLQQLHLDGIADLDVQFFGDAPDQQDTGRRWRNGPHVRIHDTP